MSVSKKMLQAAAGQAGGGALAIEDVFSTYLYTGNGSTQTITNGIDLAGEGGLVWIKQRDANRSNALYDTERGVNKYLLSDANNSEAENFNPSFRGVNSFNSDGFEVGANGLVNTTPANYASWTFRKAPRFFDVVTFVSDGTTNQAISHSLDVVPGFIILKRTDGASNWFAWHRGNGTTDRYTWSLNSTAAAASSGSVFVSAGYFNSTSFQPNRLEDYLGNKPVSGGTYVAYLFAHDPLGPSGDGSDGLIACGSYTGNGSADGPEIDLGWEPQWVMIKNANITANWSIIDVMRGTDVQLRPNTSNAESSVTGGGYIPTPTGFKITTSSGGFNGNGNTHIYIAIRRGPMRAPESGTEVFAMDYYTAGTPEHTSNFPVDMALWDSPTLNFNQEIQTRLLGTNVVKPHLTNAEVTRSSLKWDSNVGYSAIAFDYSQLAWMFRRAPGFFDVVAYTGNGVAGRTVSHNLGVAPEMMIVKRRDGGSWLVYHAGTAIDPETDYLILNATNGVADNATMWNDTAPSDTVFTLGSSASTNANGSPHIAYLFATLPGVSKVGSYTGNGTSQTIDCGFTSGARFILIKRTDSTGDWYVWDTERGIVAANDPHLSLNTTAAEVTTDDSVDPDSSGFIVNQVAATNINVSSASYIFYAVS